MNQTEDVYYTQMKRNTGSAECIKFKGTLEGGGVGTGGCFNQKKT